MAKGGKVKAPPVGRGRKARPPQPEPAEDGTGPNDESTEPVAVAELRELPRHPKPPGGRRGPDGDRPASALRERPLGDTEPA
ncbi:hypothetical protein AB0M39_35135 [Streptomyces sp. NPDC051907]|uniref:hypothetical protein n=1 Tax=Streptomyces sp. NPDC051907 TaxID=3155284 RepID=UPI0034267761